MRRSHTAVAVLGAIVAVAAIVAGSMLVGPDDRGQPAAGDPGPTSAPTPRSSPPPPIRPAAWDGEGVPPVTLHLGKRIVPLAPWTYCYGGVCADGLPGNDLEDAASTGLVEFSFPLPGWGFEVTFTETSGPCPRAITLPAERTGPRTFAVRPAGPPQSYDVTLFGRGDGGDVVTSFRWTTETSGTLPEPDGSLGIVSTTGDEQFVYQPELALNDLAATPHNAAAVITVTAANGASRTLPELRWREKRCDYAGSVYMSGTDEASAGLLDLGPFPFTYTVRLTMDGTTYTGTAVYPDDQIVGNEPHAALTFEPPLPAYTG